MLEEHLGMGKQAEELAELEADCVYQLAEYYSELDQLQLAKEHYEQAASLYTRVGKHYQSSEANQMLALIYMKQRELTKTWYHLFLALASAQLCNSLEYESYVLFALGLVYIELGRSEGLTYYKQALACFRERGDHENIENTLNQLRLAKTRTLV